MRARLNLPTALVYCTLSYLLWFWLLLVAAVCCRNFALRLLLPHLLLCVCQCGQLAFMLVVHTAVFTPYVRVSSYVPQTYDDELKKIGEGWHMKWHGLWPEIIEHSGIVRCGSTALVHACSRGCVSVCARAKASPKGRRDGFAFLVFLEILLRKNIISFFKTPCRQQFVSHSCWISSVICVTFLVHPHTATKKLCHVFGSI